MRLLARSTISKSPLEKVPLGEFRSRKTWGTAISGIKCDWLLVKNASAKRSFSITELLNVPSHGVVFNKCGISFASISTDITSVPSDAPAPAINSNHPLPTCVSVNPSILEFLGRSKPVIWKNATRGFSVGAQPTSNASNVANVTIQFRTASPWGTIRFTQRRDGSLICQRTLPPLGFIALGTPVMGIGLWGLSPLCEIGIPRGQYTK